MYSITLQVISGALSLIYVLDLNERINISNRDFVQFTNLLISCLQITMNYLPIFILFTWITPDHNETTMYVLIYSSYCFFNYSVRPQLGELITLSLQDPSLTIQAVIQLLSSFLPYLCLGLIPEHQREYIDLSTGNKTI